MIEENKKVDLSAADADFDWDAFASDDLFTAGKRTELEAMYDKTLSTVAEKEVIDGTVISLNKEKL